jgi:hypothetical protein
MVKPTTGGNMALSEFESGNNATFSVTQRETP